MSSNLKKEPKSTNYRQFGDVSKLSEETYIIIPNRISKSDIGQIQLSADQKELELVLLIDKKNQSLENLDIKEDDDKVLIYDFENGSTDELNSLINNQISKDQIILYIPGNYKALKGANFHFPTNQVKNILDLGLPVIPLFIERLSETQLSIEKNENTIHSYGEPIKSENLSLAAFQESLLIAGEKAFSSHTVFEDSLVFSILKGLKLHANNTSIFDGNDGSELKFTKVFGAGAALSKIINKATNSNRVGIVLPPGKGGLVANLAVLLSGKVPVNLNFTAGSDAIKSSIQQAGLDQIITAQAFVDKYPNFPWPEKNKILLIEKVLPSLKPKIIFWLIALKIFSAKSLASMLRLSTKGGNDEAVLLFTSGSSGNPKGVVLSHKNILSNVTQFGSRLDLDQDDKILGCLPLFHSFGSTVTLWYPMLEGIDLVTYPSPLEPPKLAELIEEYKVTLLLATPTFLRGYMRRVDPEKLDTIKFVVTGAEKLPKRLAEAFESKFQKKVMEGYGLTETSPVTNVNIPNVTAQNKSELIKSERFGSVGQFLPGIAVRITEPNDDSPLPINSSGMIWLRGPNIFKEYLDLPSQTQEVIKGGWFRTGDIGRVDEDGFLYIEGRLSRFSKIAGEMVPHETVESHINKALSYDSEDEKKIAVIGIPDEAKGEALVLLSTEEMGDESVKSLRQKLLDLGVAALWIPKKIIKVDSIPSLASGKLDIKGCEDLAKNH
ncbi:MAG: 2-acyl-glycerophospho-ethanolamine acyltransferase [Verrucomicrobiales bacterium]|nr:2-acyl-glycerophospho-ethanolamine acyltransferase [Verrucomicrobiales bacterium]